jgi:alkylation response protein AidB-like acyl-CoA dehydrogenase
MLGVEGEGFPLMMAKLAQERLAQAIRSAAVAEEVIAYTVEYTSQRKAFGQTIGDFQNTQFKLAELKTEAVIGQVFTDRCIELFMNGELDAVDAAMAKMWLSNLHCKVVDECLQLFGGWGYMWEYPIARAFADARIVKIAGGSIEIMKYIIGRSLFDAQKAKAAGVSRSVPSGWEKPPRKRGAGTESADLPL